MPQKRNPVPFEHARALASKALGQAMAIPFAVHNTPFGDIVDTEDDLQPLVASMFSDATRATNLVAVALAEATFDVARMRERAGMGWITVTELADTLTRDHALPFRTAHAIAAAVVRKSRERHGAAVAELVAESSRELCGRAIQLSEAQIAPALSPEHFIAIRRTLGGPAVEVVTAALDEACARLAADQTRVGRMREQLATSEKKLKDAAAEL